MPDIFDIDFKQQADDLISPDKRPSGFLYAAVFSAIQWCRDNLFGSFKKGATASQWAPGTYAEFTQVVYRNAIWYATTETTSTPGTNGTWLKIHDNFIGTDERVLYSGVSLVLEFALNHEFGGTFRQPGSSSTSDIFFNPLAPVETGWLVAEGDGVGVALGASTSSGGIGDHSGPFDLPFNFNINIPTALYAATNEQAIRNFTNLYIPKSINFTITQY